MKTIIASSEVAWLFIEGSNRQTTHTIPDKIIDKTPIIKLFFINFSPKIFIVLRKVAKGEKTFHLSLFPSA